MRCAYFDCFGGAAGDMILGALVHAGFSAESLQDVVHRIGLEGVRIAVEPAQRAGLAATLVRVEVDGAAHSRHRHLPDILRIIDGARLAEAIKAAARRVFQRLAGAEAVVHGIKAEQVHFHEVGAVDAIVDVVGACAGLEALGVESVLCSPIPTGSGSVRCEHGLLPVPAPATAELLRGVPLAPCEAPEEMTTPTGAAILTTLAGGFGPPPAMRIGAIGYGAGTRDSPAQPNILRVLVGELAEAGTTAGETVVVLETQVDDASGQVVAYAAARALDAGALDAFAVPIVMKKGRPGQLLTVLCRPTDVSAMERILFSETTTFGIRQHTCLRQTLKRESIAVETAFGPIRVKVGRCGQEVLQAWPEYEDCAAAAREQRVPLRTVQEAARSAWVQQYAGGRDRQPG